MGMQAAVLALCVAALLTAASAKHGNVPLSPLLHHQDVAAELNGEHSHHHGFVLKTTDIRDQDCVETSFNFHNLNDFSFQTVLSCPQHPHEHKTAKQFLPNTGATTVGYCNWAFDLWNDEDDVVQLSTTPPARQVGNVHMNCWLDIGQCMDGDKYRQDEDAAVSLIGSGVLVWVDDMYVDKVPDWFPPTDSECARYFGPRIANKRNTGSGNSTSRSHASSRMPTARRLQPAAVATAAIPAHSTPYPDASEQPRKLWQTSVLLSTGTFSVTTRSGNSYYGGTYVHTYGFDADVTPVTYAGSAGFIFTPFTVKFDFRSDDKEESY